MPRIPASSLVDRARRLVRRAFLLVLILFSAGAVAFLPFAGRFLVREDPIEPADALFVPGGSRAARWLEALDLYRAREAPLIVISPEVREPAELIVVARGVHLPSTAEIARDALLQLGVPASALMVLPGSLDNTAQEAQALHEVAHQKGWHRVIVVTSKYHTRRARFAFTREFRDSGTAIMMHASHYDVADPAHWWRSRADMREVIWELEKLLAYHAGLGG